jgi:hypothetical protein
MGYDYAAIGDFRRLLRQYRGDVFVGQAMKTVAPYAFLVKRVRQRKSLIDLWCGPVESGVEARHLRQTGIKIHCHFDGARLYGSCNGASGTSVSNSASNSGVMRAARE